MFEGEPVAVGTRLDHAAAAEALRRASSVVGTVRLEAVGMRISAQPVGRTMTGWGPTWSHARFDGSLRDDPGWTELVGTVRWDRRSLWVYLAVAAVIRFAALLVILVILNAAQFGWDPLWLFAVAVAAAILGSVLDLGRRTRADAELVRVFFARAMA